MLQKIVTAGALVVLLTGPVLAQRMNMLPDERKRTPDEIRQDSEIEQQYRERLEQIPDKKAPKDPWGNVRAAPAAKETKQAR